MTFRDDHDAAIARADALEDEVERERERADAQAEEAAKLRRERDELEAKVARLEAGKTVPEKPRVPEEPPRDWAADQPARRESEMFILATVIFVLFVVTLAIAMLDQNQ